MNHPFFLAPRAPASLAEVAIGRFSDDPCRSLVLKATMSLINVSDEPMLAETP